ncbi:aldo/keto reductase [Streptomyces sp. NPDC007991]|uniref:aldo/keto reductase n=1 Tax=Streptomyces sp. NPDC007991 TaxID=3364803 RepID=UPI0036ECBE68
MPCYANDFRRQLAWWKPENFDANVAIVAELTKFAEDRGATLAQLALAWLLAKKDYVVPIPGSRNLDRVTENVAAADLTLTAEDLTRIAEMAPVGGVGGSQG